ncbi:hypothetical protein L211DRAFT_547461 [Terfezia boudieri ATCC MYA-4762]|uniref:Uncharacterized protein n=1 Tax=Terfezia boudieri ATCC MYA-4762 TaxID=1051890 RepID=A0A3N4M3C9_9PEZI|nr:hypothetical protein L211DRAFT_547461 [Terfezia boudieri ATCC MYA-4762]
MLFPRHGHIWVHDRLCLPGCRHCSSKLFQPPQMQFFNQGASTASAPDTSIHSSGSSTIASEDTCATGLRFAITLAYTAATQRTSYYTWLPSSEIHASPWVFYLPWPHHSSTPLSVFIVPCSV